MMNLLIVLTAKYLLVVSIILYLYQLWKLLPATRKSFIILSIITFPLSLVIAKVSSHFLYDPRPFVLEHIQPLISHAADNGFPSDHTLITMTIAAIVFVYNRKLGVLLTIIALLVGVARILAQVHHLEDIIGSVVIACVATVLGYYILPFILREEKK